MTRRNHRPRAQNILNQAYEQRECGRCPQRAALIARCEEQSDMQQAMLIFASKVRSVKFMRICVSEVNYKGRFQFESTMERMGRYGDGDLCWNDRGWGVL